MNIFNANSILIITSKNPTLDALASTYALYNVLNSNREVNILANVEDQDMLMRFADINPVMLDELKPKTFVLSIDKNNSLVTKLNWKQTDEKLQIYINTKNWKFDVKNVDFEVEGSDIDLIITVGIQTLPQMGEFYAKNAEILENSHVLNIDNSMKNSGFGNTNYVKEYSSIAEVVYDLFAKENISLSSKSSQCLLTGIMSATNNLSNVADPLALLEIVTNLLKNGADYSKSFTTFPVSKDQIKIFEKMPVKKGKRGPKPALKRKKVRTVPITIDELMGIDLEEEEVVVEEQKVVETLSKVIPENPVPSVTITEEIDSVTGTLQSITKTINREVPSKVTPFPIIEEKIEEMKLINQFNVSSETPTNVIESTTQAEELVEEPKDPFTAVDDTTMPIAMEIPSDVNVGPTFNAYTSFNPAPTTGTNPFIQRPNFGSSNPSNLGGNPSFPAPANPYNPPQGRGF